MTEDDPRGADETADLAPTPTPTPTPFDSLDAGLAAGFGRPSGGPASVLDELRTTVGSLRPVALPEAEGESTLVVKPRSDAMPAPEETGSRYQLSGEIARGGMGAVLRGRDVDLGRDLAFKVLLEKYADRPEVARRFVEEAQIGGQLQHPGVVPVYDIGRFGDRPYFTMKLVKGQTLAAILDDRPDPSADRPRLLAIALQVAQTLAYAHAKGVIHRDLKPANIMVGAFGEVQVMDWGLAKVLASGGVADEERAGRRHRPGDDGTEIRTARSVGSGPGTDTEAGSLLGTPAYMPPEQAVGDVEAMDRRADVFGLGAILCEILTGRPPYAGRSGEEVRRKAANADLADALARLDGSGADAELIALSRACLAPEPEDRPKDARAVAESLRSYLDGVQDRLRKSELAEAEARATAVEEAKRRRLTLALAATILLAMTLGGAGWLKVRGDREARQVALSRDVNEALNKATALRERAKAASLGGASLLAQAREQGQRAFALIENGPADPALVGQVRRLRAELDQDEKDRALIAALDDARLAQAETVSGESRFATERAIPLFREALRAYGLPAGQGEPAAVAARIRDRPATVREAILDALTEWSDLAAIAILKLDEPDRDWLKAVVDAAEPEDDWRRRVREALREPDEARRRAALETLAEAADVRTIPPRALTRLAVQLRSRPSRAAFLRRAAEQYPSDFWINQDLGMAFQDQTPPRLDQAVRYLSVAVALRPDSPGCRVNLADALRKAGHLDESLACFRRAVEIDPKYLMARVGLGQLLVLNGKDDEGIACFREAIAIDPKSAANYKILGGEMVRAKRPDEAAALFRKAIELDPRDASSRYNLGHTMLLKGRRDEAIAQFREAIKLDPKNAKYHTSLGLLLLARKDSDEAIASLRTAIELDPKQAKAHSNLGMELERLGRHDEAIPHLRKAIELDPGDRFPHYNLGNALALGGQLDEAIACYRRAISIDPKMANAHQNLSQALFERGRLDEAIASGRRWLELDPRSGPARESLALMGRLAGARDKFADFQAGRFKPGDSGQHLGLIEWCEFKKLNRAGTGLYAGAFAADPNLADDLGPATRFKAARLAALAASGLGEDAANIDDAEKARLRKQALDWLRADLDGWGHVLEDGPPPARAAMGPRLAEFRNEPGFAGLRDEPALAKLPADERIAFERLWADADALAVKAGVRK